MNILTLDVETTISNKGNPFDQTNKLVCVGVKTGEIIDYIYFPCSHEDFMYLQGYIDSADLIVGFNIKFDLHWLRRIGIDISKVRVWDCQIGEFLLENQTNPYPSLDQAAEKYSLAKKLDIVKTEFWEKGIDTDAVPRTILSDYLAQDLILTEQVYLKQVAQFETNGKAALFKLQCLDLLVLEEYEYNGIIFDTHAARTKAKELEEELSGIREDVRHYCGGVPVNLASNDHVSALLYGGTITIPDRIPVGVFKTGAKIGATRYKIVEKVYDMPRLVTPIKGTETAKEGYWKVNADVLRSVTLSKEAKKLVKLLDRHSELEKLAGTYLNGWSDLIDKMNWKKDTIHGNLNQCTVVTGRLSSTKPNLQNADPSTKTYCVSRYDN